MESYSGVRQMGMGGAVIATVNDETALLSNPAALGKLRDTFVTIFDPEVEGNLNVERTLGVNFYKASDPQFVLDSIERDPDDRVHLKTQVFPSIIFPNFGIGLHGNYVMDAKLDSVNSKYEYNYRNDWSAVAGLNFRLFSGRLKIGANAKYTNRGEVKRTDLDPAATDLSLKDLISEGVGISSDVGMIFTMPTVWLPALAVVWRDAGDTKYNVQQGMFNSTTEFPDSVKNSLDVGLAVFPIHSNNFRSSWTVELRDVLTEDAEAEPVMRRIHTGFELNYADALFFRGGMNQRYWTAGFEIAMFNYQLQAATYGEDVGTADLPEEDRRYVLKFSYRF